MKAFMRSYLVALVLLFALPSVRAEEPLSLRWRFADGETFRILTVSRLTVARTLEAGIPAGTDRQVERRLYEAKVTSLNAEGTARLQVRFLALEVTSEQMETRNVTRYRCTRGANGWVPTIESSQPTTDEDRTLALIGPILVALADTPINLEVTATGDVVFLPPTEPRDPFAPLDVDLDRPSRRILAAFRTAVLFHDGLSPRLGLAFVRLPSSPVAPGQAWPVARTLRFAGLDATGDGTATLVGMDAAAGGQTAEIREKVSCAVETKRLNEYLAATAVAALSKDRGKVEASFELSSTEGVLLETTTRFDATRGRAEDVAWENIRIPLTGRVALRFGRVNDEQGLSMLFEGSVRVRFGSAAELPALPTPPPSTAGETVDLLEQARIRRARGMQRNLSGAISLYYLSNRRLPLSLAALTEKDERTGEPYMSEVPQDPWGGSYELRLLDRRKFQLISYGADGQEGTYDDLVWPEPE